MGKQARSSRRSSSPAGVSIKPTKKALGRQAELDQEARASLKRKADAIVEDARRRLRELVGLKRYDDLRAAIRGERLALRNLQQPPEGLERDFGKDRSAAKGRIDALLRKHGVSADKVGKLHEDTRDKLRKLFVSARGKSVPAYSLENHHDKWLNLTRLSPDIIPSGAFVGDDPTDPHRWFWFLPPYPKCRHDGWADNHAYWLDWEFFCTLGGWIGTEMILNLSDAGDSDMAYGNISSEIQFMFDAPIAGTLEVVIRAQCLRDLYEVSFVDEFGLSWAGIHQINSLYLVTYGAGGGKSSAMMSSNVMTDEDPPVNSDKLIPGKHYFRDLIGNNPLGAGPTEITIGANNFFWVWSDDMAVHSRSIFMWQIVSVGCRIKP